MSGAVWSICTTCSNGNRLCSSNKQSETKEKKRTRLFWHTFLQVYVQVPVKNISSYYVVVTEVATVDTSETSEGLTCLFLCFFTPPVGGLHAAAERWEVDSWKTEGTSHSIQSTVPSKLSPWLPPLALFSSSFCMLDDTARVIHRSD